MADQSMMMDVTEQNKIKTHSISVLKTAQALKVTSQDTFDKAGEFLKDVKKAQDIPKDKLQPIIKAQKAATKLQSDLLKEMLEIPNEAERVVKDKMGAWAAERRRIVDEQNRKRQEAADKKAADEKAALLKKMADDGATKKEIKEEEKQEVEAPKVEEKRHVAKHDGITTRQQWSAKLVSLEKLVKYVQESGEWQLIGADMVALNKLAREQEAKLAIPGIEAEAKEVIGAASRG